ncbi:MAG: prepilin-type N-terminal cleavage/methylation domain-containing protein [Armatimonadota bacterium]
MSRGRAGFTLIELLVVIAIIAILAAILFPVFAKAREKAKQASCLSGMKQMALAFLMYRSDYDDLHPYYRFGPGSPGRFHPQYQWWPEMVEPYTKNLDIMHCPCSKRHRVAGSGTTSEFWYGFGYDYLLAPYTSADSLIHQEAATQRPASKLLLCDSTVYIVWCPILSPNYWHDGSTGGTSTTLPLSTNPNARYQGVADWHNDGANIAYCDGHGKWRKIDKMVDRYADRDLWGH